MLGITSNVAPLFVDFVPPVSKDLLEELRRQLEKATIERSRSRPPLSLSEKILNFIEGPWAPEARDLPERSTWPSNGLSSKAFRSSPLTMREGHRRTILRRKVNNSLRRRELTAWTSLYEYDVPITSLPRVFDGARILHLSDIHLLARKREPLRELEGICRYVESLREELLAVVLTGDIITVSPEDLSDEALSYFARIAKVCPHSFFVLGNHDYHGHTPALISYRLQEAGFIDLNNRHVILRKGSRGLLLHGLEDAYFGTPRPPVELDPFSTNILIMHNLDALRSDSSPNVDLVLSGHTHWGESKFFNGTLLMKLWGYCANVNNQIKSWDMLSHRTLSFVHPGLARYYVPFAKLRHPPGIVVHNLQCG
jgi:predicted MPP superfamily phosphohydrolase